MNTDDLREALRRDAELAGQPSSDLVDRVATLRRRSNRRRARVLAGIVGAAVVLASIPVVDAVRGGDPQVEAAAGLDPEASAQELTDTLRARGEGGSRAVSFSSLTEVLPNRQYQFPDGTLHTVTDLVVVGHVKAVRPGRGFYTPAEDGPRDTEVAFDDPRATWRTVHAEVAVTEVLAGEAVAGDTVTVGFTFGSETPLEVLEAGLPALGEMVFFLYHSPLFSYDADVWGVFEDGPMLAEVDADGRLTMPAIEPERAGQLLAETPSLQDLRTAAQQPTRVEPVATLQD